MNYQKAIDIIKEFEGCELTAYKDTGGVWTIGYGSIDDVHEGLTITQQEAEERLQKHFGKMAADVRKLIIFPDLLDENKMCAILSLVYNIGVEAFRKSTLRRKLNKCSPLIPSSWQWIDISNEFLKWDYDDGEQVAGLTRRRKLEKDLFLTA